MKRTLCLLLFLSLTLTGCAAAAPGFDLSAGEIAAAEGLTLHMPQAELPDPWTDTDPSLADIEYAGLDFAAEANFADGELTSLSASCEEASREDVDALLAALNADYGIELVKTYDKGDFLTYAFRRNRHSVQVNLLAGRSLSFRIHYLPEMPGYEWV